MDSWRSHHAPLNRYITISCHAKSVGITMPNLGAFGSMTAGYGKVGPWWAMCPVRIVWWALQPGWNSHCCSSWAEPVLLEDWWRCMCLSTWLGPENDFKIQSTPRIWYNSSTWFAQCFKTRFFYQNAIDFRPRRPPTPRTLGFISPNPTSTQEVE